MSGKPAVVGLVLIYWAVSAGCVGLAYHVGYAKYARGLPAWASDSSLLLQVARDEALAYAAMIFGACAFIFALVVAAAVAAHAVDDRADTRGSDPP
jgi:hypothetical protein